MTSLNTFQCSVVTPERMVLECDATFVAFPAHDGEMGVLPRRAPLVCKLGIGALRIERSAPNRDRQGAEGPSPNVFFIDGGFAQVLENRLTLLTQRAVAVQDIDAAAAERDLAKARQMKITDEASCAARSNALRRAQVQLKLAKRAT